MQYDYNQLLTTVRKRLSTINRSNASEQFYSDRSRVIYNSSFRRLQQKAQVFSLEPNASVRTRLTHSLEVSDLGRTLANKIAQKLCSKGLLSAENISSFIAVVENACLLHDIGNPPFGHFGESAIRDWAQNRALNALDKNMYIKILKEPKNAILKQYKKLLALDEVDLRFDDTAYEAIAEEAVKRKTGARALRAIIERFMLDIMYQIPRDDTIGRVTITGDYIKGKGSPVIELRGTPVLDDSESGK